MQNWGIYPMDQSLDCSNKRNTLVHVLLRNRSAVIEFYQILETQFIFRVVCKIFGNIWIWEFQKHCRVNSEIRVFVFIQPYRISLPFHKLFITFDKVTDSATFKDIVQVVQKTCLTIREKRSLVKCVKHT